MRPHLREFMRLGGESVEITRDGNMVGVADGLRNTEQTTRRKYIGFYPEADIRTNDWVKGTTSGDEFHIVDVFRDIIEGEVFQIKGFYETKAQYEERLRVEAARAPNYNIGAIVHSMSGGTLQAIGETENSSISQIVNDPNLLQAQLDELVNQLLDAVKSELPASALLDYADAARQLKQELQSSHPDIPVIRRLLQTLAFFGDVEGTIGLMTRVWPVVSSFLMLAAGVLHALPK